MSVEADSTSVLRAGAGRAEICLPDQLFPMDGFTGRHDPLHLRTLLIDNGRDRIAIVSVEMTSLSSPSVAELTADVARVGQLDPAQVVITATHTFSAPHLDPAGGAGHDELARSLGAAAVTATSEALRSLRAATMSAGTGCARVAVNRDVQTINGWWLGADDAGTFDADVAVIRFVDPDGAVIATVFNHAVQSSVMNEAREDDGGRLVTGDLAGAAARYIEGHDGDPSVALFLIGAAGDQAPYLSANRHVHDDRGGSRVDIGSAGHILVHLLGERLGRAVLNTADTTHHNALTPLRVTRFAVEVGGQTAPASFRDLHPSTSYSFRPDAAHSVPFWLVEIGAVAIVGLQPELSACTGITLKRRSPFPHTVIATMVNGAAKYMPDAQSYDRRSYEAMSSRYARGSAETVTEHIVTALGQTFRAREVPSESGGGRS